MGGKSAALTSLAEGADLLVAGMNEQRLAVNVAEFYAIPFAALHFFPARALELGGFQAHITNVADGAQRATLGLPGRRRIVERSVGDPGLRRALRTGAGG